MDLCSFSILLLVVAHSSSHPVNQVNRARTRAQVKTETSTTFPRIGDVNGWVSMVEMGNGHDRSLGHVNPNSRGVKPKKGDTTEATTKSPFPFRLKEHGTFRQKEGMGKRLTAENRFGPQSLSTEWNEDYYDDYDFEFAKSGILNDNFLRSYLTKEAEWLVAPVPVAEVEVVPTAEEEEAAPMGRFIKVEDETSEGPSDSVSITSTAPTPTTEHEGSTTVGIAVDDTEIVTTEIPTLTTSTHPPESEPEIPTTTTTAPTNNVVLAEEPLYGYGSRPSKKAVRKVG